MGWDTKAKGIRSEVQDQRANKQTNKPTNRDFLKNIFRNQEL